MSTDISNLKGHLIALLNITKLAVIGNNNKPDSPIAISMCHNAQYALQDLFDNDLQTYMDSITNYKNGAFDKVVLVP